MEGGCHSVEIFRSRKLLGNLSSPASASHFSFQALTSSEFSSTRQIFSLKSAWMKSKVFPLALKRMALNSATAAPIHSVLNSSHGVIRPTSIIEGSTYQYITGRVIITARGLFLIRLIFWSVFFPKDFTAWFEFAPIIKCAVWTWRLTNFSLRCRLELLYQYKFSTPFSAMRTFYRKALLPLRNQIFRCMTVQ